LHFSTKESIMSDIVPFAGKPWAYVPVNHPVIKVCGFEWRLQ